MAKKPNKSTGLPAQDGERPASGPGWGGPAKGAGAPPFDGTQPGPGRGHEKPAKAATAERMLEIIGEIAESGEYEANRLNAASKWLDRTQGLPTARQVISGPNDGPIQTQQVEEALPPIETLFPAVATKQ